MKKSFLTVFLTFPLLFICTFASAFVHTEYVKYENVPVYETVYARIVFDNSGTQYLRVSKEHYLLRFNQMVDDLWKYSSRAEKVTKEAFDSASNKLSYRLITKVVGNLPAQKNSINGFQVSSTFTSISHMICSDPPYKESITRESFKTGPVTLLQPDALIEFQDMLAKKLRFEVFNLLPIQLTIEKIEKTPKDKIFIYFRDMPYDLWTGDLHSLYFYESSDFRFKGNQANLDSALGKRMYGIKYDKKAGTNYTRILKSDPTDFSPYVDQKKELLAVLQRKLYF